MLYNEVSHATSMPEKQVWSQEVLLQQSSSPQNFAQNSLAQDFSSQN